MKNNMSPANLVARSAAIMGALSACVSAPPPRLLSFRQRGGGTMSIARPAPLTMLAIALTLMAVAAALFILYAHPAHAEEGSAPDKPIGLTGTATHDQVVLTWDDPRRRQHHRLRGPAARPGYGRQGTLR